MKSCGQWQRQRYLDDDDAGDNDGDGGDDDDDDAGENDGDDGDGNDDGGAGKTYGDHLKWAWRSDHLDPTWHLAR